MDSTIKTLLALIAILCWFPATAQQIDSLERYADTLAPPNYVDWLIDNFSKEPMLKTPAAIPLYEKGLQQVETLGKPIKKGVLLRMLGMLRFYNGDYPKAMEHYLASLTLLDKENALKEKSNTLNELSVLASKQKKFARGLQYLEEAYATCAVLKDSVCMSTAMDNAGVIYMRMEKVDSALTQFNKVLALRLAIGDSIGLGYVYNNLAWANSTLGNTDKAISYIQKSTDIREALGDERGVMININNIGETYATAGNLPLALQYFKRSLSLLDSSSISFPDFRAYLYGMIAQYSAASDNFSEAYTFTKKQNTIKDSLLNEAKQQQLSELEVKYETAQREEELQRERANLAQAKLQNLQLMAALVLVAVVGLALFLVIRAKQKQKLQQAILSEKERGIAAVIEATEEERKRISQDLHDSVGQQIAGLRLAFEELRQKLVNDRHGVGYREELDHIDKVLSDTSQQARAISHQMMPQSLEQNGLAEAIESLMKETFRFGGIDYDFSEFGVRKRDIDKKIALTTYRVTQELLNNTLKHANATQIDAQLRAVKENLILTFEDNGKGMLLQTGPNKGHGLLNMETRLGTVNGKIHFEGGHGPSGAPGTLATVTIPLN